MERGKLETITAFVFSRFGKLCDTVISHQSRTSEFTPVPIGHLDSGDQGGDGVTALCGEGGALGRAVLLLPYVYTFLH